MVFGYQREKKPLLFDYVRTFWSYSESPYVKRKLIEGSSITKMQCSKMLGTFENHCKGCLNENMRLDAFKVSDMEKIKSAMYDKGLSSSAINKAIECLRTPLNEAYRTELIDTPIGQKLKNVKRTDGERGILTTKESEAVLKYLKESTDPNSYERAYFLFVGVMLFGGLRNSEVSTLTAEDIEIRDDETAFVHVRHSFNRLDGVKGTKTGKERFTTIPAQLAKEMLEYNRRFNPFGFIFFSPIKKENPIDDGMVRDAFYDALKKIGIEEEERTSRGIVLYSLRHQFDSKMVASGLSETEVRAVIGHSSSKMTMHYYHQDSESLERQAKARAEVLPYVG